MNIEGPYRPLPKDDQKFDPEIHKLTKHKKGPLKGKETWIRKSATASDAEAKILAKKTEEAEKKEHSWLGNILRKKGKFTDVFIEEVLAEHLGDLKIE